MIVNKFLKLYKIIYTYLSPLIYNWNSRRMYFIKEH